MKRLAFALLGILFVGISIGNAAPDGHTTKAATCFLSETEMISPEAFTPETYVLEAVPTATSAETFTVEEKPVLYAQADPSGEDPGDPGVSTDTGESDPPNDTGEDLDELVDEAIDHVENKPEPGSSVTMWGGWLVAGIMILWRIVVYFKGKTSGT